MLAAVVSLLFRGEGDVMVQELAKLGHLVAKKYGDRRHIKKPFS